MSADFLVFSIEICSTTALGRLTNFLGKKRETPLNTQHVFKRKILSLFIADECRILCEVSHFFLRKFAMRTDTCGERILKKKMRKFAKIPTSVVSSAGRAVGS